MKKNLLGEPKTLTIRQKRKLKKQFPLTKEQIEILKKNKKERFKNKLEILIILGELTILIMLLYVLYLMVTYQC